MTDLVKSTFEVEAEDGTVVKVAGGVVDDFVLEQEHSILGPELHAKANEGIRVKLGRFEVELPAVEQYVFQYLAHT